MHRALNKHPASTFAVLGSGPSATRWRPSPDVFTITCNRGLNLPAFCGYEHQFDYELIFDDNQFKADWYQPLRAKQIIAWNSDRVRRKLAELRITPDYAFGIMAGAPRKGLLTPTTFTQVGSSGAKMCELAAFMGARRLFVYGLVMVESSDLYKYYDGSEIGLRRDGSPDNLLRDFYKTQGVAAAKIVQNLVDSYGVEVWAAPPSILIEQGAAHAL